MFLSAASSAPRKRDTWSSGKAEWAQRGGSRSQDKGGFPLLENSFPFCPHRWPPPLTPSLMAGRRACIRDGVSLRAQSIPSASRLDRR